MDMGKSMYNHNKAQQSKNRVHISWDILYILEYELQIRYLICIRKMANEAFRMHSNVFDLVLLKA